MKFVPILGHQLNQVFPCVVALVVVLNVTQVYSRFLRCMGLSVLEFEWAPSLDEDEDPVTEGKALIERERRRREEEAAVQLQCASECNGLDRQAVEAGEVPLRSSA